ncbi:MAG: pentapeptide repeat-containing protein [Vampirovibrionales bacterium]|nr:pentapeptide repeat-containing protein [Vampirovibrionales bacterium]
MADDQAVSLLQEERAQDFNRYVEAKGGSVDLSGAQLKGFDLRRCRLERANLTNAYLRSADLRALDLSQAKLDGASIKEARISGVLFPRDLSAHEIRLSVLYGTRLRQGL